MDDTQRKRMTRRRSSVKRACSARSRSACPGPRWRRTLTLSPASDDAKLKVSSPVATPAILNTAAAELLRATRPWPRCVLLYEQRHWPDSRRTIIRPIGGGEGRRARSSRRGPFAGQVDGRAIVDRTLRSVPPAARVGASRRGVHTLAVDNHADHRACRCWCMTRGCGWANASRSTHEVSNGQKTPFSSRRRTTSTSATEPRSEACYARQPDPDRTAHFRISLPDARHREWRKQAEGFIRTSSPDSRSCAVNRRSANGQARRRLLTRSRHRATRSNGVDSGRTRRARLTPARRVAEVRRAAGRIARDSGRQACRHQVMQFVPPGHFYSPIPQPKTSTRSAVAFLDAASLPGIAWTRGKLRCSSNWPALSVNAVLVARRRASGIASTTRHARTDGIFYSMLALAPRRLIEIGSGFTSALTLDTQPAVFDGRLACTFIEPYPHC